MPRLRLLALALAVVGVVGSVAIAGHVHVDSAAPAHECVTCLHAAAPAVAATAALSMGTAGVTTAVRPPVAPRTSVGHVARPTDRGPPADPSAHP